MRALLLSFVLFATAAQATDRVALVVGMSDYPEKGLFIDLDNPVNDARLIADSLERTGFAVSLVEDADRATLAERIREFEDAIPVGGTAVFYFAGHGIQYQGENYLMASNARFENKFELGEESVKANTVLAAMSGKNPQTAIVFLDCCREPPPTSWIEGSTRGFRSRGLADMQHPDMLISFAAAPDQPALDGSNGNSPFATALAKEMLSGAELGRVMKAVANEVFTTTAQKQRPWLTGSLLHDFYFTKDTPAVATKTPAPRPPKMPLPAPPTVAKTREQKEAPALVQPVAKPAETTPKPKPDSILPGVPTGNIDGVDVIFVPIGQ